MRRYFSAASSMSAKSAPSTICSPCLIAAIDFSRPSAFPMSSRSFQEDRGVWTPVTTKELATNKDGTPRYYNFHSAHIFGYFQVRFASLFSAVKRYRVIASLDRRAVVGSLTLLNFLRVAPIKHIIHGRHSPSNR